MNVHPVYADGVDAVLINAGGQTHYSYGILEALHHQPVFGKIVMEQNCSFGVDSNLLALRACRRPGRVQLRAL